MNELVLQMKAIAESYAKKNGLEIQSEMFGKEYYTTNMKPNNSDIAHLRLNTMESCMHGGMNKDGTIYMNKQILSGKQIRIPKKDW